MASEEDELKSKIDSLKLSIAQDRAEKTAQLLRHQLMAKKQSQYSYDSSQVRAKKAGYATESEKLMGGQTGYFSTPIGKVKIPSFIPHGARATDVVPASNMSGLAGYLGEAAISIAEAASEVIQATEDVKKTTSDVKHGVATRADLVKAMAILDEKVKVAQSLSAKGKALSGFGSTNLMGAKLAIGAIVILALIIMALTGKK